jgi:hypothetical protein
MRIINFIDQPDVKILQHLVYGKSPTPLKEILR